MRKQIADGPVDWSSRIPDWISAEGSNRTKQCTYVKLNYFK